jgi:hypothetical protein
MAMHAADEVCIIEMEYRGGRMGCGRVLLVYKIINKQGIVSDCSFEKCHKLLRAIDLCQFDYRIDDFPSNAYLIEFQLVQVKELHKPASYYVFDESLGSHDTLRRLPAYKFN